MALERDNRENLSRDDSKCARKRGTDDRRVARVCRHEPDDGISRDDGGATGGITARLETDWLAVFALRPDSKSLSQNYFGYDFWGGELQKRSYLEKNEWSQ